MLQPSVNKEDDAATESQLMSTSATLEGWSKGSPPTS